MSASVSAPLPLPEPLGSQVPPAIPFPNIPVTVLNWFRMAPAKPGPANTITRPMIAMTRTYSIVDCPFRRRVNLGDTPPRKELPLRACAAPFGLLWLILQRIDMTSPVSQAVPLRHMGRPNPSH